MTDTQEKLILKFLNCVGINTDSIHTINGIIINRQHLLSEDRYAMIKTMIPELKTLYSSSYMTSLQKSADKTHKWPLINIVRQVLKSCGYQLKPKRISNGYSKNGRKIYKRLFIINKNDVIKTVQQ